MTRSLRSNASTADTTRSALACCGREGIHDREQDKQPTGPPEDDGCQLLNASILFQEVLQYFVHHHDT